VYSKRRADMSTARRNVMQKCMCVTIYVIFEVLKKVTIAIFDFSDVRPRGLVGI
jgi:hypothetical protein